MYSEIKWISLMRADLASTAHSGQLDASVRDISKTIDVEGFVRKHKMTHELLAGNVGCSPDGGLWFREGYLEVAFEAKHQGPSGNAIERWFKNYWIISSIYPQAKLITFCTGEGALKDNGLYDVFKAVLAIEGKDPPSFNTVHKRGASFYMSRYGFSAAAINDIMMDALLNDGRSSGIKL